MVLIPPMLPVCSSASSAGCWGDAQVGRRQYGLNSLAFVAALIKDNRLGPVTALLLADGGYALLNPPEGIKRWGRR